MRIQRILILFLLLFSLGTKAQQPVAMFHENKKYIDAKELFEKEKYAAAHNLFKDFILEIEDPSSELAVNAKYYANVCSLYLFHRDAEYNLESFVEEHPESAWVKRVYLELAKYNYKRNKAKKALEWFEFINPRDLSSVEKTEFYFKRGHSYFQEEQYENAKQDFKQMLGEESEYQIPATYYYAHIAYVEGNNQTALEGFQRLSDNPDFAPVIPYYIAQIYYKQERYDDLLEYALPLVNQEQEIKIKRIPEISRLIGDAYYRSNDYESSLPHLERYIQSTNKSELQAEDYYQLGFAYYSANQFENALDLFSKCAEDDSEIGQSASYYMGDCYLKTDQKTHARAAFKLASESDYNITLKEDALFNYAKLAFELSYNPFHEAITAFEKYLEEYPNSQRGDEAYEFLLNVYMKSKNYEAALASLDRIENKDNRTKEAYQVVAFNRAVELFKLEKWTEAQDYFNKVNTYKVNYTLIAEAIFWKGEIEFEKGNYPKALTLYKQFMAEAGSIASGMYNEANYGAAYALFKQKKYEEATTYFRKYVDSNSTIDDDRKIADAYLRLGDSYYVSKSFEKAIEYYNNTIAMNQDRIDYAKFQKGICYGKLDNKTKEIQILEDLIATQPNSPYVADSKYALGENYLASDQLGPAEELFNDVRTNHSNSPYVKKSLLNLLLISLKKGNDQEVINYWNTIIDTYPNDPVQISAYKIAEEILIENDIDIPSNVVAKDELEEKTYEIAENYAIIGDYSTAIVKLQNYLTKYEPGLYATSANYYLGRSYFELGDKNKALNAFNYVVNQPISEFTEECLVLAATINYNNKNYGQAKNHYVELEQIAKVGNNELEAQIGLMRCYYFLNELTYAQEYADKVISNSETPSSILKTAHLWRGKIRMEFNLLDDAYYDFAEVIKMTDNIEAAESKYNMAEIAYKKQAYKPAEKEIFQLIEKYSSFAKWKYKGFLLLADVYVGMEDYFQARATLNTILDNVSEPWVIDEARAKLDILDAIEENDANGLKQEDLEIDLSGDDDKREEEDLNNK